MIQKALLMAFVMVISNLKSSRWFKIYSRKTLEKRVKKAVFLRILRVKVIIIQKNAVFRIKEILLVKKILKKEKLFNSQILSQSQLPAYNKMSRITLRKNYSFFILSQIFQNMAGNMFNLIKNVYNYIFACILASNHRIFSFYLHYER